MLVTLPKKQQFGFMPDARKVCVEEHTHPVGQDPLIKLKLKPKQPPEQLVIGPWVVEPAVVS
jgi:hypothetical protein